MMKRILIILLAVVIVLSSLYFVGTGFLERMDVLLYDYSVSEDGTELTFSAGIMSSMGFIRGYKDNGGGVKDDELPKLFQRFYRAEHQNKNGAGIGLAIVKEIIQRHHGNIIAENGKYGLKMTISMPMLDRNLTNS